jgi:8-oxo-dGTP pyrophosphatase MutT (NUDIX family)
MNSVVTLAPIKPVTCASIIQYYDKILCCHVTNQLHWDLPKGLREENETNRMAAWRELREETGINLRWPHNLDWICAGAYTREKNIDLYGFKTTEKYEFLRCTSMFTHPVSGVEMPEVDDFAWVTYDEFISRAAKTMQNFLNKNDRHIRQYLFGYTTTVLDKNR